VNDHDAPRGQPIEAVLFDVDGTLYHARRMRLRAIRSLLLRLPLRGIGRARTALRILRAYRRALEDVRHEPPNSHPLAERHIERAAELAGVDGAEVRALTDEWLLRRALAWLLPCKRRGLDAVLTTLRRTGCRIGFFSDYPVAAKLTALRIDAADTLQLSATDAEINAFKPWPHGFRHAAEAWSLRPDQILYVGDRVDVDATGAAAAGMRCAIFVDTRSASPETDTDYWRVRDFPELLRRIQPLLVGPVRSARP